VSFYAISVFFSIDGFSEFGELMNETEKLVYFFLLSINNVVNAEQTTLPEFSKPEFSVVRQHEEFVWLHDRFEENEEYAGIVVSIHNL